MTHSFVSMTFGMAVGVTLGVLPSTPLLSQTPSAPAAVKNVVLVSIKEE